MPGVSPGPPTLAGSCQHPHCRLGGTHTHQEPHLPRQPCWRLWAPTSFWSSWREDLIKSRRAVSCFFSSSWVCFIYKRKKLRLSLTFTWWWAAFHSPRYTTYGTTQCYSPFPYSHPSHGLIFYMRSTIFSSYEGSSGFWNEWIKQHAFLLNNTSRPDN